ncbi:GlyGly-CTERM sorting domain-containing protein [Dyadobacter frigoris]|uniref:GlyGly-CTERM sorting domain-containing protein n=1 Tax=Dyadobacter frigoris TaxID=2576211 RepID=A0A4V6BJD0_9BACT|nr:GlyGly-CTERM sorting domain-containing protein [Dyadobacter frigoris]
MYGVWVCWSFWSLVLAGFLPVRRRKKPADGWLGETSVVTYRFWFLNFIVLTSF